MKEVQHKPARKVSGKACFIIVLLLITVLTALFFIFLYPKLTEKPLVLPEIADQEDLLLYSCPSDQLFSVMITPKGGEPYTLAWHDGVFSLEGDEDYPIRQSLLTDLSVYATYVTALGTLIDLSNETTDPDGHTITRADFGLQPASCTVLIRALDGSSITLYFGDYFEDDAFIRYYLATDKNDTIYIVSSDLYDSFAYDRHMLHTVERPDFETSLIDAITITGETELSLARKNDYWFVTVPYNYPANTETVDSFLSYIGNIRFSSWAGDADNLDLETFGLARPRLTVTLEYADKRIEGYDENDEFVSVVVPVESKTLLIGNDASATENISFYCLYNNTVYIGTYFTMGFLTAVTPSDFYLPNPISYAANAIEEVTFSDASQTRTYQIELIESVLPNGELETDPDTGEQIYSLSVTSEGTAVNTDNFLIWYNQMTQISAAGLIQNTFTPDADLLCTILLRFNGNTREISFYRYDTLHVAISVDGTCLFYLLSSALDGITELP